MWFPTPEQIAAGAKAAQGIYNALSEGLVSELIDRVRHGRPTFMVFGPGGTGKSTLKRFLETLSENDLNHEYVMSAIWEGGGINGRRFADVKVFPGQKDFRDGQIENHRQWFRGIRRPFIVLCCSYGYRAVDARYPFSRNAPQANDAARQEELTYVDEILSRIRILCGFPKYKILLMILKQDLWWEEEKDVREFYETKYVPIITKFAEQSVGMPNVTYDIFPMCLIRSNLRDVNGNIIKNGSGLYDEEKRREHTVFFLHSLGNMLRGS
jgi:hypothetical protein